MAKCGFCGEEGHKRNKCKTRDTLFSMFKSMDIQLKKWYLKHLNELGIYSGSLVNVRTDFYSSPHAHLVNDNPNRAVSVDNILMILELNQDNISFFRKDYIEGESIFKMVFLTKNVPPNSKRPYYSLEKMNEDMRTSNKMYTHFTFCSSRLSRQLVTCIKPHSRKKTHYQRKSFQEKIIQENDLFPIFNVWQSIFNIMKKNESCQIYTESHTAESSFLMCIRNFLCASFGNSFKVIKQGAIEEDDYSPFFGYSLFYVPPERKGKSKKTDFVLSTSCNNGLKMAFSHKTNWKNILNLWHALVA